MKKLLSLILVLAIFSSIAIYLGEYDLVSGDTLSGWFEDNSITKDKNKEESKPDDKDKENTSEEKDDKDTKKNIDENNEKEKKKNYLEETIEVNSEGKKIITNPSDTLVLVNKNRNLPSDYIPEDLVVPNVPFYFEEELPKKHLRKVASEALEKMFDSASDENLDLIAASGYRSYKRQKNIFEYKAKQRGEEVANQTSARPGQSEHQTGLAMDITSPDMDYHLYEKFGQTKEGKWLKENAHKFGFILRYPKEKENITGYSYEPWHFRYVGKEIAKDIYNENVTLEEYLRDYQE